MTTFIQNLHDSAKKEWGILVGPKSNQFNQEDALKVIVIQTSHSVLEEVKKIVEGKKLSEGKSGEYFQAVAYTYDDKMLVNAVLDDITNELNNVL